MLRFIGYVAKGNVFSSFQYLKTEVEQDQMKLILYDHRLTMHKFVLVPMLFMLFACRGIINKIIV